MHRDYYTDNVDTFKEKNKVYYARNRPKIREPQKNYYSYNKSKTNEIKGNNNIKTYTKKRLSRNESCEKIELVINCVRRANFYLCSM